MALIDVGKPRYADTKQLDMKAKLSGQAGEVFGYFLARQNTEKHLVKSPPTNG